MHVKPQRDLKGFKPHWKTARLNDRHQAAKKKSYQNNDAAKMATLICGNRPLTLAQDSQNRLNKVLMFFESQAFKDGGLYRIKQQHSLVNNDYEHSITGNESILIELKTGFKLYIYLFGSTFNIYISVYNFHGIWTHDLAIDRVMRYQSSYSKKKNFKKNKRCRTLTMAFSIH